MRRVLWPVCFLFALVGCRAASSKGDSTTQPAASTAVSTVVDSVIPMDVALARFRRDLPQPTNLRGTDSRDALVVAVVNALARNDTLTFERLALNRAEWAWLYYPTTPLAHPPYELPPALAWFQLQETNRKGVFRALREYGGQKLDYRGYHCSRAAQTEGANRIWTDCTVTLALPGEASVEVRLFAAILERDGRFAVLSYHNDF